jgi:hypothetical protein
VPRSLFIIDIHLTATVNAHGHWSGHSNPQTELYVNNQLDQKETAKIAKHATHYYHIGLGFVSCHASCSGVLGQSAASLLMALASLQLCQHEIGEQAVALTSYLMSLPSPHFMLCAFVRALLGLVMQSPALLFNTF